MFSDVMRCMYYMCSIISVYLTYTIITSTVHIYVDIFIHALQLYSNDYLTVYGIPHDLIFDIPPD